MCPPDPHSHHPHPLNRGRFDGWVAMTSLPSRVRIQSLLMSVVVSLATIVVPPPTASAQHASEDAFGRAARPAGGTSKMTLRPGDRIRLRIWREPDLSGEFSVTESGVVTLPKLGPFEVIGRDPDSLRAEIVAGYAKYLVNSSMDVAFLYRVQVQGEVRTPNLYYADETMTVGDVLALAGGGTEHAKLSRIELIRGGQRLPFTLSQTTVIGQSPIRSGDQLLVPEKSWFARNPGLVVLGLTTIATLGVRIWTDQH